MGRITKELFINSIAALQKQIEFDKNIATKISDMFGLGNEITPYNNSILTNVIFNLLELHFPSKKKDIEIFCFDMDFGRFDKESKDPIGELWEYINSESK